jgi:hypothetical protein
MGNLKNFYYEKLRLELSNSEYWDFYLASDETCLTMYDDIISGSCLVAQYDFNEPSIFGTGSTSADTIYSMTTWTGATNGGVSGVTWGFTGIDNGQIPFEIPSIGNESLLSGLTGSTLIIPSGDTRLCLNRVTGNTVDETEFIFNGDFTAGLSGWTALSWVATTGDTIETAQAIGPPNIITSDVTQILNVPLDGGKKYLYTMDILSLEGQFTVSGSNEVITGTGRQSLILDLTNSTGLTSAVTTTLSGYTSINAEIDNISVIGYEPSIIYPIEQIIDTGTTGNYARFCGGFYQGYYKLDGEDYQVLPNRVPKGWTTEFILRKSDLNCSGHTGTTLNDLYPENKGMFFYLGTRAENKFWNIFEGNNTGCTSGCTSDTGCTSGDVTTYCTAVKETDVYFLDDETGFMLPLSPPPIDITKIENQFLLYGRAGRRCNRCGAEDPDGLGTYHACDDISNVYITGYSQTVVNEDNKFLTFCRSCRSKCGDCGSVGCNGATGGTCTTVCEYTGDTVINDSLDPNLDVYDNALGFRIKDDGSIGYRSLVFTGYCSGDTYVTGVTVQEEYSVSGMVSDDEWTKISIRFVLNETYDECELEVGPRRKGKLMFYVNCRLKFVSEEIDEFIARRLIEQNEKQLTVPYNLSLGGGSQGLLESMTFDGQDAEDLGMLIEQNYAGTFIGDISQFRFYACNLSWCDIKNNCHFDDERYDL